METPVVPPKQPGGQKPIDYSALEARSNSGVFKTAIIVTAVMIMATSQLLPMLVRPSLSNSGAPAPVTLISFLPFLIVPIFILVVFGVIVTLIVGSLILKGRHEKAVQQFALVNGWKLSAEGVLSDTLPSALRGMGSQRFANGYMGQVAGRDVLVYEFSYTTGSGKDSHTYPFTIACIGTKNNYPELFIDSHANGQDTAYYGLDQKIKLEGNFDKYFSLFAAKGQQVDALSIVTPDIMELLINLGKGYDVEVRGHQVSVISVGSSYNRLGLPQMLEFIMPLAAKFDRLDVVYNAAANASSAQQSASVPAASLVRTRLPLLILIGAPLLFILVRSFGVFGSGPFSFFLPTIIIGGASYAYNYWRQRR